jgi:L-Ala-D/L-Glu epimerase
MKIIKASIHTVNTPMKHSFVHASAIRKYSDSVILKISDGDQAGFGECAPRSYVTNENSASVYNALKTWIKNNIPLYIDAIDPQNFFNSYLSNIDNLPPNAKCALELALIDLYEKKYSKPVGPNIIKENSDFIPVIDGNGRSSTSTKVLSQAKLIKIKSALSIDETLQRIQELKKFANSQIMIDVNNGWHCEDIIKNVDQCLSVGVSWFEEPTKQKDYKMMSLLRSRGAKILLDESIIDLSDLYRAIEENAIDGANIRIAKCGGLKSATDISNVAKEYNLERYYGVQVAEIGTLITAGRKLSLSDNTPLGVEAGQADIFFNENELWTENCSIQRDIGIITRPKNDFLNGRAPK